MSRYRESKLPACRTSDIDRPFESGARRCRCSKRFRWQDRERSAARGAAPRRGGACRCRRTTDRDHRRFPQIGIPARKAPLRATGPGAEIEHTGGRAEFRQYFMHVTFLAAPVGHALVFGTRPARKHSRSRGIEPVECRLGSTIWQSHGCGFP